MVLLVAVLRDNYLTERYRIEVEYKNARSSRRLMGDLFQASSGLGFERAQDERKHAFVIESFYSQLLCEKEAGCTEIVVATVQCILDLNLCLSTFLAKDGEKVDDVRLIDDICSFWDSEAPRLGELCGVPSNLPSSTDISDWCDGTKDPQSQSVLALGSVDWITNGRPENGWVRGRGVSFWEELVEREKADEKVEIYSASPVEDISASAECVAAQIENESFAVKFLNDWFLKDEIASRETPALQETNQSRDVDSTDDPQLVYSSVHGYRIPKPVVLDTSTAYRKILRDLKGDGREGEDNTSIQDAGAKIDPDSGTVCQADMHISEEEKASLEQFLPLRLQCRKHESLLERQPERAVFSDDIRKSMFLVTSKPSRARLIARCVSALGVKFPNSEVFELGGLLCYHQRITSSCCHDTLLCAATVLQTRMANRRQGSWRGPAKIVTDLVHMSDHCNFTGMLRVFVLF